MNSLNTARTTTTARSASAWNLVLGIWILISPFILGYRDNTAFMVNNVILGIVIALLAWARLSGRDPRGASSTTNLLLGIWMLISPFVLGFHRAAPRWNNIILGILVLIIAATARSAVRHYSESPAG